MASIIEGTDLIVDEWLASSGLDVWGFGQAPHYKTKTTLLRLTEEHLYQLDASTLINNLTDQIYSNWGTFRSTNATPSTENWRTDPQTRIDPNNTSPEVILERAISHFAAHWFNNVPTSASILHSNSDAHRKIDLAHWEAEDELSLFELKIKADTPLSAAVQVLRYTLLYVFSKTHAKELDYTVEQHPLLFKPNIVHVRVLAPIKYYLRYSLATLSALEKCLQNGFKSCRLPYSFDFQFLSFATDFKYHKLPGYTKSEVHDVLKGIAPLNEVMQPFTDSLQAICELESSLTPNLIRDLRLTQKGMVRQLKFALRRFVERPDLIVDEETLRGIAWKIDGIERPNGNEQDDLRFIVSSIAKMLGIEKPVASPLTYGGAFIRLGLNEEDALRDLEDISDEINNPILKNYISKKMESDKNGFLKGQLVCGLFCFAHADLSHAVQEWFDLYVDSDTWEVSFDVFEQKIGIEQMKTFRAKAGNIEAELKAKLPQKAD